MNKLILTADSGSTKTDWLLHDGQHAVARISTQGINPFMLDSKGIALILRDELLTDEHFRMPDVVAFYGAGCRGELCNVVELALRRAIPSAQEVTVGSDLLGAAIALCGKQDGIACILGTGSNSGLYIKGEVVENVSPLGYILGDEGSGAVLGKRLIGDVLKGMMPATICKDFREEYGLTVDEIIQRVYREPLANRFLASFAPFLSRHRKDEAIHALLTDEFTRFFRRNVMAYDRKDLPVSFVGSVAYFFQDELKVVAKELGFSVGRILKNPLDAWVRG